MLKTQSAIRNASLLLAGLLLTSLPRRADAILYEVFVDINNEEDLYDLRETNVIDENDFENLVELLQRGVDLNEASRKRLYALPNLTYAEVDDIIDYREEVGRINDPAALVAAGIVSAEKLEAIAIFLQVGSVADDTIPIKGRARIQSFYSSEDRTIPASALQVRANTNKGISTGLVAFNTRLRIDEVRYDPSRQALTAEAPGNSGRIPKLFVQWESDDLQVIAGTYRAGFGQRLTFDNTDQTDPDGFYGDADVFRGQRLTRDCRLSAGELGDSPCPASEGYTYITPDFRSRDGLLGAALALRELKIGKGTLDLQAFVSYQPRQIYQYELYSPTTCEDPTLDTEECSAPDVYRTNTSNPLAPSPEFSFQTLGNVYAEKVVGANTTYHLDRRTRVGVTGYGAQIDWLVEGIELDFQEWSRLPYGGGFGAVGVDAASGFGITDVFLEVTRSFDSMPAGGGMGSLLRAVTAWDKNEVETSLRYYGKDFANPHARPIAAPDQFDGLRARDEVGGRVRYTGYVDKHLRLRTNLDYWESPGANTKEILGFVRGDLETSDKLTLGLWTQYQDKDLARSGREQCFVGNEEEIGPNGPISCAGQRLQLTGRARYNFSRDTWLNVQYQHEFQDDNRYDDKYRQDMNVTAILTTKSTDRLRFRIRSRFFFEDISDTGYLEQSWWTYVDMTYRLRQRDRLRVRYDNFWYLDSRSSTASRNPNPEHWLRLDYEAKF